MLRETHRPWLCVPFLFLVKALVTILSDKGFMTVTTLDIDEPLSIGKSEPVDGLEHRPVKLAFVLIIAADTCSGCLLIEHFYFEVMESDERTTGSFDVTDIPEVLYDSVIDAGTIEVLSVCYDAEIVPPLDSVHTA